MVKQGIMIAAGGTGGHIYPAVALAQALEARARKVQWVGSGADLEKRLLSPYSWPVIEIAAKPYRQSGWLGKCQLPFVLSLGVIKAIWVMLKNRPAYVITTGGYVSVATALAAKILCIKVYICEQNARPGLANRLLCHMAEKVFTAYPNVFPQIKQNKIRMTGNPLREQVIKASVDVEPARYKKNETLIILIMGGSQGANILNVKIPTLLANIQEKHKVKVIHQAGAQANIQDIEKAYAIHGIQAEVLAYLDPITKYYQQSHLVIARSGALTITELIQFQLPAILVPLPNSADNHQFYNALYHQQLGSAWLLPQDRLVRPGYLANMINTLRSSPAHMEKMQQVCQQIRQEATAKKIIDHCLPVST